MVRAFLPPETYHKYELNVHYNIALLPVCLVLMFHTTQTTFTKVVRQYV